MSKNEQTHGNPKDAFSVYQENVDKIFTTIKQSVPQYHQSITNIQQEYLQAYENIVDSSISLQKEYTKKLALQQIFLMQQLKPYRILQKNLQKQF